MTITAGQVWRDRGGAHIVIAAVDPDPDTDLMWVQPCTGQGEPTGDVAPYGLSWFANEEWELVGQVAA